MSNVTVAGLDQAVHFVQSQHLDPRSLDALRDWYGTTPSRPIHLTDFLTQAWAQRVSQLLVDFPLWSRVCRVYDGPDKALYVSEAEWLASDKKWARSWIGSPIDGALRPGAMSQAHQHTLRQFLAFSVLRGPLTAWLSAATGVELGTGSIELASYGKGDSIGVHQDRIETRAFAVNFYLDPLYRIGSGCRLGYRNEHDEVSYVDPVHNSISIIPIQAQSVHWVEEFADDRRGRYTISVGQNRVEESV